MNFIWSGIVVLSLMTLIFVNPSQAFGNVLLGSQKAVELSLKLWSIYAVWLGILKILEDTGINKMLAKLLRPVTRKLMGKHDDETEFQIAINITSNVFGMGNASTPSGISAISGMYKGGVTATKGMLVFFVLNTTNLQLIPTTIIGLRIFNKSLFPNNIIAPTILSSIVSVVIGVSLIFVCDKIFKKRRQKT